MISQSTFLLLSLKVIAKNFMTSIKRNVKTKASIGG